MTTVTFLMPDAMVLDLTAIAKAEGFPTAKAMAIHWMEAKVRTYREQRTIEAAKTTVTVEAIT